MATTMDVPLEVSTRGLSPREAHLAKRLVRHYSAKLATISDDIIMCRVVVEKPQKFQASGNPYRIRVLVTAPGHTEVVVVKDPGQHLMHDPMQTVIRDAFTAAARSLDNELERRRGRVKNHEPDQTYDDELQPSIGFVLRVRHELDHGFLRTPDGREIYFHRNAVLHGAFDDLHPGTKVRFEVEQGEDGPQATTVQVLERHGPAATAGPVEDPAGWFREED